MQLIKQAKTWAATIVGVSTLAIGMNAQAQVATYTIPVVVHVLYNNANVNTVTTPARIVGALNRTNQLYQGKIAAGVLDGMANLQGALSVEFKLAQKKPDGSATTGYEAIKPTPTTWATDAGSYIPNITAKYNWDSTKYLNIYVVEQVASNGMSGVAWMPSEQPNDPAYNAVFIDYRAFGGAGDTIWKRYEAVLAHEVGHSMNLKHTFGHNGNTGVTCGNDGIADTPTTWGKYEQDVTVSTTLYACGNWTNVENVMDYTRTQTMFTKGQLAAVEQTLKGTTWSRNNLWTAANLTATGLAGASGGTPTALTSGVSQSVNLASASQKLYTIAVPSGTTSLNVNLSGGTGDGDIYTKFGSAPTTTTYDLASNGSTNTEAISVANPSVGTYYVLVDAYAAVSNASLVATVNKAPALLSGVAQSVTLALNQSKLYSITVPAGKTSITVALSGGTGDGDLYTKFNQAPSTTVYDQKSDGNTNTEQIVINTPQAGTYYVMVYGYAAVNAASVLATVK